MYLLGSIALGYLVASFVVSFYLAATLWGTQGTPLVAFIVPMFPLMPVRFAANSWWSPVAAFLAILAVTSLQFALVLAPKHFPHRGKRLGLSVLVLISVQCLVGPLLIGAFGARQGSDEAYGRVMIAAVVVQVILAAVLCVWSSRLAQIDERRDI